MGQKQPRPIESHSGPPLSSDELAAVVALLATALERHLRARGRAPERVDFADDVCVYDDHADDGTDGG